LIWARYFNQKFKKSRQCCWIPLCAVGAAGLFDTLVNAIRLLF